jgi:hypothetical protein
MERLKKPLGAENDKAEFKEEDKKIEAPFEGKKIQSRPKVEKAKPYFERSVCLRGLAANERTGSTTANLTTLQTALMRRAGVRPRTLKSTIRPSGLPVVLLDPVTGDFNWADLIKDDSRLVTVP